MIIVDNKQDMLSCNLCNDLFNRIEHEFSQTYKMVGTWS